MGFFLLRCLLRLFPWPGTLLSWIPGAIDLCRGVPPGETALTPAHLRHPPISRVRIDGVPPRPDRVQLQIPSLHIFHCLPVLLPRIVPVILFHIQAELQTFGAESPPISSGFDHVNSPLYPLGPFLGSSLRFCICL